MANNIEQVMAQFQAFIADKVKDFDHEPTEAELKRLSQEFMIAHMNDLPAEVTDDNAEDVYDYLELADRVRSKKKKLEYLHKAKELDPDNFDVLTQIEVFQSKDTLEMMERLKVLVRQGKQKMKEAGYYKHEMGEFWLDLDARPYMRMLMTYTHALIQCQMFSQAISVAETMMKLDAEDHQGVRFLLMHLYAYREDEMHAIRLARKNREEAEFSSMFLLPLSILYFKLGDWAKAEKYMRTLQEKNKDFKKFVRLAIKDEVYQLWTINDQYGYQPGTGSELREQYEVYDFLLQESSWAYYRWAKDKMTVHRKKKTETEAK